MAGIFLGKNAVVPKEILPANTNQALAILRLDQSRANPFFISYFLRQPRVIDYVNNMSGQSAQPNINFEEIKSIDLLLPSLDTQKSIASILSSLDEKIDLLHRQNATLEKLAETLFRQWFVEEAKEEWEENPLTFFGNIVCGKTPPKSVKEYFNGDVPFIKIPDMHGRIFVFDTEDSLTKEGVSFQANKTLPPRSISVSCIATVGLVTMNAFLSQTNQQINSIVPNHEFYRYFLYIHMKNLNDELQSMASGGTATLNLNTRNFSQIKLPLPNEEHLTSFHEKVNPLFEKIFSNQTQVRTLTNLRDTLLPKLMSGEVRVEIK
jgi:type I restriction enzyme S subunit